VITGSCQRGWKHIGKCNSENWFGNFLFILPYCGALNSKCTSVAGSAPIHFFVLFYPIVVCHARIILRMEIYLKCRNLDEYY
jgi:hypothetical protein